MPSNLSTSVEIDAPADHVWSIVSDLGRMGEWSPQCRKVIVRGDDIRLGTRMININRAGWKVWPTRSKVISYEPGREIAFRVKDNRSIWRYQLQELPDGATRVTETRDVSDDTTSISKVLVDRFLGGEANFETDLMTGMKQTLARIKAEAEATHTDR